MCYFAPRGRPNESANGRPQGRFTICPARPSGFSPCRFTICRPTKPGLGSTLGGRPQASIVRGAARFEGARANPRRPGPDSLLRRLVFLYVAWGVPTSVKAVWPSGIEGRLWTRGSRVRIPPGPPLARDLKIPRRALFKSAEPRGVVTFVTAAHPHPRSCASL